MRLNLAKTSAISIANMPIEATLNRRNSAIIAMAGKRARGACAGRVNAIAPLYCHESASAGEKAAIFNAI